MAFLKLNLELDYDILRLITAGIIFIGSYSAHRKITFNFVKKIGIAIYLSKKEDVRKIYSKIKYYSDFVHLDLVDNTFSKDVEVDLSLMKDISNTWGLKKMLHIMSTKPSIWIKKLSKDIDIIIFHFNIDEGVEETINLCKKYGKKVGLTLTEDLEVKDLIKYLSKLDFVQVMGIGELGKSGQNFNINSLKKVKHLNKLKKKYSFEIIFDGGVKPTNISKINAKYVVSASGLLSSKNPITAFMELKTSQRYTRVARNIRRDIFLGIRKIVENLDFIKSGNIVGSFSDGQVFEGMNDIDIVLILDKLTKNQFKTTISNFEKLRKEIESRYATPVFINNSLGPLKFNENSIVFHLMLYDLKTHKEHCISSPFTCYDWQRSKIFIKQPMSAIYKVWDLKLKDFFNSRRSAEEYLSEIKSNKISYRTYEVKGNKVFEKKNYKEMDNRDRIEFASHIVKFLISNFLKVYYFRNEVYSLEEMLKKYFDIFPKNKKIHKKIIQKVFKLKKDKTFINTPWITNWLELFIKDFEIQFKQLFEIK